MSLTHPSSVGAPVALWFSNGVPVRLVHGGVRYRVIGAPEATPDGWMLTSSDLVGRLTRFEVRSVAAGWQLLGIR